MENKTVIRKEQIEIVADLVAAALLLGTGVLLLLLKVDFNSRAFIGSSFIPIAMAGSAWYKIWAIRKYPKEMRPLIISLQDERLTAARNEADAITHNILQWLLRLSFFCYTLIVPADIFESVGWWITFVLFFLSIFLPIIVLRYTSKEQVPAND
jgi:hypothetical protein